MADGVARLIVPGATGKVGSTLLARVGRHAGAGVMVGSLYCLPDRTHTWRAGYHPNPE